MAHFELLAVRQQVGPADFVDEGQPDELFEFPEPFFGDGEFQFLPRQSSVPAFGLEAKDVFLFTFRDAVRGKQDFPGADADRGLRRDVTLSHVQRQEQRQTDGPFGHVILVVLRPSGDHPFAFDFQWCCHQFISSS